MKCDYCGDIDPANPGQSTADTVLCIGCTREAAKVTEPDHIVTGPPTDDDEGDEPTDDNATPIEEEYDLPSDDDDGPVEDRSTWPAHEPDMGEPVGECQLCGETMGQEPGDVHANCSDRELHDADRQEYDDARNLNAADIMAEIRRMS